MSSSTSSLEEAKREAQREVAECEKEIGEIKAIVKSLATAGRSSGQQEAAGGGADSSSVATAAAASADAAADNGLTVVLLKAEGLTDESKEEEEEEEQAQSATKKECKLRLSLQLSSPIEEGVLSEFFDPELPLDSVPETMKVDFRGVETNQATLTLMATNINSGAEIGTSEPIDLSFITKLEVMNPIQEYVTDLPVVIYPADAKQQAQGGGDEQTPSPVAATASCTVTIRLSFVPSQKDLLEELYELLNKATTQKLRAVDKLRQIAAMASRQSAAAAQQQQMAMQPAVRAGFLNKTPKAKEAEQPSKLRVFYDRYLGPQTLWRQMLPLAKNYIMFAIAVSAMHFKGHNLALPPPV